MLEVLFDMLEAGEMNAIEKVCGVGYMNIRLARRSMFHDRSCLSCFDFLFKILTKKGLSHYFDSYLGVLESRKVV